jgi:hypothetical protein
VPQCLNQLRHRWPTQRVIFLHVFRIRTPYLHNILTRNLLETKHFNPVRFNMLLHELRGSLEALQVVRVYLQPKGLYLGSSAYFIFSKRPLVLHECISPSQRLKNLTDIHETWHKRHVTGCHHNLKCYYFLKSAIRWLINKTLRWRHKKCHFNIRPKRYTGIFTHCEFLQ